MQIYDIICETGQKNKDIDVIAPTSGAGVIQRLIYRCLCCFTRKSQNTHNNSYICTHNF